MNKLLLIISVFIFAFSLSAQSTFVGPEKCLQCHSSMAGWRSSMHANGYSDVTDDSKTMQDKYGVVNDYDQNGVDDFHDGLNFNNVSGTVFDVFKPNAPILAYSANDGYTITIGDLTMRVLVTYGGSGLYKQRYALVVPCADGNSADLYVSPIQYNEATDEYVLYHASDWYDGSNLPIYTAASTKTDISGNSRSFTKGCAGCHVTGLVVNAKDANGEWTHSGGAIDQSTIASYTDNNIFDIDSDGVKEQMNVGCEACHGPGSVHAAAPSKDNMSNPATDLTVEEANNMCGMCHSRGKSLPNNTFSYAYHDDTMQNWSIGELVDDVYTDGGGYYGDNVDEAKVRSSRQHHQQFRDLYESSKPTFAYHQVACYECHDMHNDKVHHVKESVVETDSTGADIVIATASENNTLCLSCHATHGAFEDIPVEWVADYANHVADIGAVVTVHSKHPYDPEGTGSSNCTKCHNPRTNKSAVHYDIISHTFETIPPEKTKNFNMPNACAVSCHMQDDLTFGIDFSNDNLSDWSEATDLALADSLMKYYGPGGIWWDYNATAIDLPTQTMPTEYILSQNYPNPFNPVTNIEFEIPKATQVTLTVYNVVGQLVTTLIDNQEMIAGKKLMILDASNFSSGIYFYTLKAGNISLSKKMMLIR